APLLLHFTLENGSVTVQAGDRFRVEAGSPLQSALNEVLGAPATRFETIRPRAQTPNGNSGNNGRRNGRREVATAG
ncbi:MAG: hypothetical protein J2P44_10650, partial [Candidatus Dormibacteraeota bacterium]|nr:hypothetical protein [Candidatus Dormibacteraeota bacterium]